MEDPEENLVKQWTEAFTNEVLTHCSPEEASDEEVFGEMYHALAHSPLAATMIQLEHSHAHTFSTTSEVIETTQEDDWERVCRFSNASHVRETQRREFRQWIQTVHEDSSSLEPDMPSIKQKGTAGTMSRSDSAFTMSSMASNSRSESFTITLGAQMKAMHNLRIVAGDIFGDICKYPEDPEAALPQRLQTSMALYSNNLSGLVLLSDDLFLNINDSKVAKDFNVLCGQATEYHFPTFEQQLESMKTSNLEPAIGWRLEYMAQNSCLLGEDEPEPVCPPIDSLKCGDFYVTRHSNLSDVHVVFHMAAQNDVNDGSINSRHPVIMGLRNVLKAASMNSITTLTIPLLLTHTMEESMTIPWCMKRAELVYKCIKGFLMEMASWGGSEIKTLQFLVPKDIDSDVFSKLSLMLPTIFRTFNPIRATL